MPVVLTGSSLTIDEVVRVARWREVVEIDPGVQDRVDAARRIAQRAITDGKEVYGLTTGVGMRKIFRAETAGHDRLLVRQHRVSQGPDVPHDVVRAQALRFANAIAQGTTTARFELLQHVVRRLNENRLPPVRALGSVGQGDLAPMADLAEGLLEDFEIARGEAIVLLNQGAFSTAYGALGLHDALQMLDTADIAGALDLEALAANQDALHPVVGVVRPFAGLQETLSTLRGLLDGSAAAPRALQDPLSFRTLPQVHGAARDALAFVRRQVETELNASQGNPLVLVEEQRVISVGNFDIVTLATALDVARLALAPVISSACERSIKLLQASITGLPEGLAARHGLPESALSELGIAIQAFASEARLLAAPVSYELVSTLQAEGIEDRMTMAPLAARRLAEMVSLWGLVVTYELVLAAQACDLRGHRLGSGTARAYAAVRERVAFVDESDALPDLTPLVELVRSGQLPKSSSTLPSLPEASRRSNASRA